MNHPRSILMIHYGLNRVLLNPSNVFLFTLHLLPIPKSPFIALKDPNWCNAMYDEYNALVKNTSTLLQRLVIRITGVDFDETFSPVVKAGHHSHRFSLDVSRQWPIHQLDVKECISNGLFLSQKKYARQLLKRAHMVNCNQSWTPIDTDYKLGLDGVPVQDPTLYRSLAGVPGAALFGYTNADWAGCPSTRRSTSGYCMFLGDNLLSWSAKRQHTISRSSAKAKYRGVANVVAETAWIRNLLRELHSLLLTATLVYCDNYADIFTKGLPSALFEDFRSSLSVRPPPAPTAGAY
ncbi:ribonuclease H-like domain-containing protein [Tanacetum coccineum]